jgi:hypothetical protein
MNRRLQWLVLCGAVILAVGILWPKKDGLINFYGKVTDAAGSPLSGVEVKAKITGYSSSFPMRVVKALTAGSESEAGRAMSPAAETIRMVSAADGKFSLTGKRGHSVLIEGVNKAGYSIGSEYRADFRYGKDLGEGGHRADEYWTPASRFTLVMWKVEPGTRLISSKRNLFAESHTNIFARINLFRPVSTNDQEFADIELKRSPWDGKAHKWELSVSNGGSQWTAEAQPFQAPERGYQQRLEWFYVPKGTQHEDVRKIYIKAREGRVYGVLTMKVALSGIVLEWVINPLGFRNLSGNETNTIKDLDEIKRLNLATQK